MRDADEVRATPTGSSARRARWPAPSPATPRWTWVLLAAVADLERDVWGVYGEPEEGPAVKATRIGESYWGATPEGNARVRPAPRALRDGMTAEVTAGPRDRAAATGRA